MMEFIIYYSHELFRRIFANVLCIPVVTIADLIMAGDQSRWTDLSSAVTAET
jgi:hypothetical protein